jgi:peroxiredoxin (alkyl hydroperoxide reductase subunit C)
MSVLNTTIKPFNATAYKDGKFVDISDETVKGKWAVFFFYPADFTFVCPTELEDLADIYPTLQNMGVEVFAVSTDTHFCHKAWHDTSPAIGKINYYMVGDQNHNLSNNFEVLRQGVGLADRGTFVLDPQGEIQLLEITPEGVGRNIGSATPAKSAPPSGKKAPKRSRPRSTSSARSKSMHKKRCAPAKAGAHHRMVPVCTPSSRGYTA